MFHFSKKHSSPKLPKNQKGATLAEFMLWGALFAGVVVIGVAGYRYSKNQTDTARTGQEFRQLQAATRTITNGNYGTVSLNSGLVSAGAVPGSLTGSGSTITNGFGGAVTVVGGSDRVTITQAAIPKEVCVQAITDIGKTSWVSVAVNGGTAITSFPISLATAETQCSGTTNSIAAVSW